MKHLIGAVAALILSLPTVVVAQDLAVHTGLVLYPLFYGQTPESGNADRELSGLLGVDLTFEVAKSVHLGPSVDGAYVQGAFRGTDGFLYSIAVGPTGMLTSEGWTGKKWIFGLSLTPALLVSGVVVKGADAQHTVTAGGAAELSLRVRVTQSISLGGFMSFGAYGPPFNADEWRGKQLGPTLIGYFDLGVIWRF